MLIHSTLGIFAIAPRVSLILLAYFAIKTFALSLDTDSTFTATPAQLRRFGSRGDLPVKTFA
jgi:hypothetical protein